MTLIEQRRCKYCGMSFAEALFEAAIRTFGGRSSGPHPIRCRKAPAVQKYGPRGGIKYVREHYWEEVR